MKNIYWSFESVWYHSSISCMVWFKAETAIEHKLDTIHIFKSCFCAGKCFFINVSNNGDDALLPFPLDGATENRLSAH